MQTGRARLLGVISKAQNSTPLLKVSMVEVPGGGVRSIGGTWNILFLNRGAGGIAVLAL